MRSIPDPDLADRVRAILAREGERRAAALCGASASSLARIAAQLPCREKVIAIVALSLGGAPPTVPS